MVGASSSPEKLGAVMAASLSTYAAPLMLVNSRSTDGSFHPTISDAVAACPAAVDLAVLCVRASAVPAALRECSANSVRAAVVCAGGFAEAGGLGIDIEQAVRQSVRDTGIRLLGPNTSGFFIPRAGLLASFVPGVLGLASGPVAVVASSGGVNHALAFRLQQAGVGVSLAVGLGASIDVAAHDVLDYLAADSETKAVGLHIETVTDGPALVDSISRMSVHKPVVALVVGRNDVSDFARSHTGALATSWRTTRAVLRQAGALVVDDENELVEALAVLGRRRLVPAANPGVALITAQAGPGLLIMDALGSANVAIPPLASATQESIRALLPPLTFQANPVDTGRPGDDFHRVIASVAADHGIDAIGIYALTEPVVDLPAAVSESKAAESLPVLIGVDGPRSAVESCRAAASNRGIPLTTGPSSLAKGLIALVDDARIQFARSSPVAQDQPWPDIHGPWDEVRSKELLSTFGIATPARFRCQDHSSAHDALMQLTLPVAVKLVDAAVLHKTEIGGVCLNVDSAAALDLALERLDRAGGREYLLEEMVEPGIDLVVGARRDPVFGPIVVLGLGGIAAEVLADVAIRAAPLSLRAADSMLDELQSRALLFGFRNGPTVDRQELSRIVVRLGGALAMNDSVAEIEINPLRLTTSGLVALDAVVIAEEVA